MSVVARYVLAILCFGIYQTRSQGIADSVIMLDEVILQQSRLDSYAVTGMRFTLDSASLELYRGKTLAEVFRFGGIGMLRGYSPGGLATASLRGTGSSHTAVLWHGISLSSPMNGQLDLSQIPAGMFNLISVQEGGNSSLYGSGSVGGTIQFSKEPGFNRGLDLSGGFNAGSFGLFGGNVSAGYSSSSLAAGIAFNHRKSDNNFTYDDPDSQKEVRWQHAEQKLSGLAFDLDWQPSSRHYFYSRLWLQENRNQIPTPSTVNREGTANQEDRSARALAGYIFTGKNIEIHYQAAVLRDYQEYADSLLSLEAENVSTSIIQHIETTVNTGSHTLTAGMRYIHERGRTTAYLPEIQDRNRYVLSGAWAAEPWNNWLLSIGMREEIVNGEFTPFSPSINLKGQLTQKLIAELSFQRNYRLPTFNDLYWKEAGAHGNPSLLPEVSIGGEAGMRYNTPATEVYAGVYSQWIDDWIQWVPVDSRTWSPRNIRQVWSRGILLNASHSLQTGKISWTPSGIYRYTLSTNNKIYDSADEHESGKQLILTPEHSGSLSLAVARDELQLRWITTITGNQFTDSDNTDGMMLEMYSVSAFDFIYTFGFNRFLLAVQAGIDNLFDARYESRPGYPMPGRAFQAGINLTFN